MESNTNPEQVKRHRIFEEFPFLKYLKGRLVDYHDPITGKRWTGHVAMFYRDTNRLRIDWDNGATTVHDFSTDSRWLFKATGIVTTKGECDGTEAR